MKEEVKAILNSICVTDEDVTKVVDSIRKEILPKFNKNIIMKGEKILVRKIWIKEKEKTEGGVIILQDSQKNLDSEIFYATHPFQAVIIAVGENFGFSSEAVNTGIAKNIEFKPGDHIFLKSDVPTENLIRGGVIIDGHIFGYVHNTDIICVNNK